MEAEGPVQRPSISQGRVDRVRGLEMGDQESWSPGEPSVEMEEGSIYEEERDGSPSSQMLVTPHHGSR